MPSATQLSAPQALLRGALCFLASLALLGCERKAPSTPNWPQPPTVDSPASPQQETSQTLPHAKPVLLMVYNLQNYLGSTPQSSANKEVRPKPEDEILALVQHITNVQPDLLGVCEIGTEHDLHDLQERLKKAGLTFPHSHLVAGSDRYRRQAILSRHPLTVHPAAELYYTLEGKQHKVSRGILDVSIQLTSGPVRLIGVHLKSKRASKYWDQDLIRRHEAQVVRDHISTQLKNGHSRLLLYGDFNDSKQSPTLRCIKGPHDSATQLKPIDLTAADGSKWTHYWEQEDVYSRFDYIFASPQMAPNVLLSESSILDTSSQPHASDHRPHILSFY